jgi:hypothetical protein
MNEFKHSSLHNLTQHYSPYVAKTETCRWLTREKYNEYKKITLHVRLKNPESISLEEYYYFNQIF